VQNSEKHVSVLWCYYCSRRGKLIRDIRRWAGAPSRDTLLWRL